MRFVRFATLLATGVGLLLAAWAAAGHADDAPGARKADGASIDAVVAALYDVISGPKGQPRDWDRFRALFVPGARLIPVVHARDGEPAAARVMSVDEFAHRAEATTTEVGFFEREIARRAERFGHIAHVFSTYEARETADAEPFTRGINSIQLFHDGECWRIVTIYWDSESADAPIPPDYLPNPPRETSPR